MLKFIKPVRSVKAHNQPQNYFNEAVQAENKAATAQAAKAAEAQTAATGGKTAATQAQAAPSSGVIKVSRDGTPWINMVTNLMAACGQGSSQARGHRGTSAYQSAQENRAELRRKTVGRIVNIVTEDRSPEDEAANQAAEQLAQGAEKKSDKHVDHFNVPSQQNVLKKPA